VTQGAIVIDGHAVFSDHIAVVAAEAADRIVGVSDMALICFPGNIHLMVDIAFV